MMECNGAIKPTDWKLYIHLREKGRDALLSWGPEKDAHAELQREAQRGSDVWLVTPTGKKILPS